MTQQEALAAALAYAFARTDLPAKTETGRDYADRLVPLMVESGYLAAIVPEDAVVEWWTDYEQLAERMREVWSLSGRDDPFAADEGRAVDMEGWHGFALGLLASVEAFRSADGRHLAAARLRAAQGDQT